jgi:hypothetical protein
MEVKQHWHPNSSQYCEKKSPHHQLHSNIVVVSLANAISKMRLLQNKVTNYGNNQLLPITSMTSLLSTGTDIRSTVYWDKNKVSVYLSLLDEKQDEKL